jgi:hypothetical protein
VITSWNISQIGWLRRNLKLGVNQMLKKNWSRHDNFRVHNSKVTLAKTEEYVFKRTPHQAYSPDITPSYFYLLGYAKEKLKKVLIQDTKRSQRKEIYEI